MKDDIQEIILSPEAIQAICKRLGEEISKDYWDKDLLVVGILKGASIFMSDLVRAVNHPVQLDFMAVSSYGLSTESSGVVKILKDLDVSVEGKHVLIVEDIVDTGLTLNYLTENLYSRKAKSVKICTLLDKPARRKVDISIDYRGIEVPDAFIVGYGIDYAERYRNLPYVAILKPEVYNKNI